MVAPAVPDPRDDPRLVVRDPVLHAVAEARADDLDVLAERVDDPAGRPAAMLIEHLRRVPVEERAERRDAVVEQLVDEAVVEVEPLRIDGATSLRQDARPRDREAKRVDAELP